MEDMKRILRAGADKIGMNTAAVKQPELISAGARKFGSQCIVVAIDAKYNEAWGEWEVYTHGGRTPSGIKALDWVKQAESLGAGEILLTSMDADGTKDGFDLPLTSAVASTVQIPVIASGGAGKEDHFYDVFTQGKADAGLAATIFTIKRSRSLISSCSLAKRSGYTVSEDMLKDLSLEQVSEHIRWDAAGLVPAIVQDAQSKQVLMMAYMNRESLRLTLESGETWFWSRSREELWHKGRLPGMYRPWYR